MEKQELELKWKPEMEMEKQMMEMQPPTCSRPSKICVAGFHAYTGIPESPPTSSFNCTVVVIICTLPYDRLLMSICCLPRLMSSVLCYYSCKVPFIRLAIWLALSVMCFSFSPIVCYEICFHTVHGVYTPTLLPMPMYSVL